MLINALNFNATTTMKYETEQQALLSKHDISCCVHVEG